MPTDIIPFAVEHTEIEGLKVLQMKQITDERGTVREFYRESSFLEAGLPSLGPWLQVNVTETRQGALRGLHGEEMFKLVAVDPSVAIAWPLPVEVGNPAQISPKDAGAPGR